MKSIKTKVIVLVLSFVIVASISIGFTSVLNSYKVVENDSIQVMNLLCDNRQRDIDEFFNSAQQSVHALSDYAKEKLDDFDRFVDDQVYRDEYTQKLTDITVNAALNTTGSVNVYVRYNPELTDSTAGLFYGIMENGEEFQSLPPTDLNAYASDDMEHVGWFYEAKQQGKSTWIGPYYNQNIQREVISYSMPFYYGSTFVGVVGMDIDFESLKTIVKNTHIYDEGYAFLADTSTNIVYHPEIEQGVNLLDYNQGEFREMAEMLEKGVYNEDTLISYTYTGTNKKATFRTLVNGMRMVVSVPESKINGQAIRLIWQMLITLFFVIVIAAIFSFIFARRLVQPLLELTQVAKRIARGELRVKIRHESKDEVGELAESFRQTVVHLDRYFHYINKLAYRDSLTGVKNMTAYTEQVSQCNEQMEALDYTFSIIVFDLNDLKTINDTYGHSSGDQMIMNASYIICSVFKNSPVFRIGGDEFVVYLADKNDDDCKFILKKLDEALAYYNGNPMNTIRIEIARGFASLKKGEDHDYSDVFKRADEAMYEHKAYLKIKKG